MNEISHERLKKMTEVQLFQLQHTIIAHLKKRAERVQLPYIVQHYSGCYTIAPVDRYYPNYLKEHLPAYMAKYKEFVHRLDGSERIVITSGGNYDFVRKFYKYIKNEDGTPVELKFEIVLKDDPEWL